MTETQRRVGLLDVVDGALSSPTSNQSVYLDGAAWSEALQLRSELAKTKSMDTGLRSETPRIQAELDQCESRLKESELKFTFRQLPRLEAEELADQHPATEDDMPWNPDTYPQALIAAACISVTGLYSADGVTVEEVNGLWERLGQKQTDDLFRAAWNVQLEAPKPFWYAATEPIRDSEPNSTSVTE